MLSPRWYKVLNDLAGNKTRTVLIVLSIAVGLFAVGTIINARQTLSAGMARSYASINPSDGTVRTAELFGEDFLDSVRATRGVRDADARRLMDARIRVGDEWNNITLFVVADYQDMRVNKIFPQAGQWPPPKHGILIERAALPVIKARVGDTIRIRLPSDKERDLLIAGTVHDLSQIPAHFDNTPYGYISFETLEWFGESYGFNEVHIVANDNRDRDLVQRLVNRIKDKAEKNGYTIPLSLTAEPGQFPMDEILQAVLLLMGALGLLSLFLSTFLIVNTVTALLAQQRRQIGVMKALGARSSQIMGMYLGMVLLYGVGALLLAIPSSIAGSRPLSALMATAFNFDLGELNIDPSSMLLQVVIGLLVPVLASLYPFLTGLRVPAAEAMSTFALGRGRFGSGLIDRAISGRSMWAFRRLISRPTLLSIRNTFRNKPRLGLTLLTLTLGGGMFIAVFSVSSSIERTIDDLMHLYQFDVMIVLENPQRVTKIEQVAKSIPGVVETDHWIQISARRVRPDGSESKPIYMFAPRPDSRLVKGPAMLEGRWLLPEDDNAIVIDAIFRKDEGDLGVGDDMILKIEGKERKFRIVGMGLGVSVPIAYASYGYISRITGETGRAQAVMVATSQHDTAFVGQAARALENEFKRQGLRVSNVTPVLKEREEAQATFSALITLLLAMAILLAVVGGLGLMGTMTINVLERTREIGVLRAIGAPNRSVARVFIMEGVSIGVLSWGLGALLAFPLGRGLSEGVGAAIMGVPLTFAYSVLGLWVWLGVVVVLSILASFLPARNAARLTVREVLAYE